MEAPTHTLEGLFEQLGLDSSPAAIDAFISQYSPLAEDCKLVDAEFWTAPQAAFLKQQLREDADWAPVVDELNLRLHQAG